MIPTHLHYYCRGAGKVPISNHIIYHDRFSPYTLMRYCISVVISFLFAVLFVRAIHKIQEIHTDRDYEIILMLHSEPVVPVEEKKMPPPQPKPVQKKPAIKTPVKKKIPKPKEAPKAVSKPETPKLTINKPKIKAEKPSKKMDIASRKKLRLNKIEQQKNKPVSSIKKPKIDALTKSNLSPLNVSKKSPLFSAVDKKIKSSSLQSPDIINRSRKFSETSSVPMKTQRKGLVLSEKITPRSSAHISGIKSPRNLTAGDNGPDFVPMDIPKADSLFPAEQKGEEQYYDIAAIDKPSHAVQDEADMDSYEELQKTAHFDIDDTGEQQDDYEHVIEKPNVAGTDSIEEPVAQESMHASADVTEELATGEEDVSLSHLNIQGVPLSRLTACKNAREEAILTEKILNVIGDREVCSDSLNRYLFSGTKRNSSFGMIIQPITESRLSDRCGELNKALKCLSTERN